MSKNTVAGLITLGIVCAIGPIVGSFYRARPPATPSAAETKAAAAREAEEAERAAWEKREGEIKGACMSRGGDATNLPTKYYMQIDKACDIETTTALAKEGDPRYAKLKGWLEEAGDPVSPPAPADDLVDPAESDILAQAENEVNQAYEALYGRLDGAPKTNLFADQELWTRKKDSACNDGLKVHLNCRVKVIADRRDYLNELAQRIG